MATQYPSAGDAPLKIKIGTEVHELIIRVRSDGRLPVDAADGEPSLRAVVQHTIGTWMVAMSAVFNGTGTVGGRKSAVEQFGIKDTLLEPHCTVWNKNNGPSLTVHSNENGQGAVDSYYALLWATQKMQSHAPQFFPAAQQSAPSKNGGSQNGQSANDPAPAQSSANSSNNDLPAGVPFVRSMKPGVAAGFVAIESGKPDSPNWQKQAKIATEAYHPTKSQFAEGVYFAAYQLAGVVTCEKYQGALALVLPLADGSSIRIVDRGGEHNYEWDIIVNKLSINEEDLAAGQSLEISADYVVMKLNRSDNREYKNFYGFFRQHKETESA